MKRCGKCGEHKPVTEFPIKCRVAGTLQSYCKICARVFSRTYYLKNKARYNKRRSQRQLVYRKRNREFITHFLHSHHCVDCGESDPVVLEFDHVDGQKDGEISIMVASGAALHRIQSEILKCEVRCANCHRRKTAQQFGWYRFGT